MTRYEHAAVALADRFPGVDPVLLVRSGAFRAALDTALAVATEATLLDALGRQGTIAGARSPEGVVIGRLRTIPGLVADRTRLVDEARVERAAEASLDGPRARALREAADRGAVLRLHVERGVLDRQEALATLDWEMRDDELLAVGLASFEETGARNPPVPAEYARRRVAGGAR